MANFQDLPFEVIEQIFSHVGQYSRDGWAAPRYLQPLPLICKHFHALGCKALYSQAILHFNPILDSVSKIQSMVAGCDNHLLSPSQKKNGFFVTCLQMSICTLGPGVWHVSAKQIYETLDIISKMEAFEILLALCPNITRFIWLDGCGTRIYVHDRIVEWLNGNPRITTLDLETVPEFPFAAAFALLTDLHHVTSLDIVNASVLSSEHPRRFLPPKLSEITIHMVESFDTWDDDEKLDAVRLACNNISVLNLHLQVDLEDDEHGIYFEQSRAVLYGLLGDTSICSNLSKIHVILNNYNEWQSQFIHKPALDIWTSVRQNAEEDFQWSLKP